MSRRSLLPCLALLPALLQAAPRVQAPDAAWITFTTAHYRIHCPAAFQSFGQDVASRVEGIHDQYLGLVGFAYQKPIDILILDPVMEANGMAFPLFQRPHVVLWKTEPEADSAIGHHRGWAELLVTHELGHMHHLLRPARNPSLWKRWMAVLGPVADKSPRWITEGYATLIEGKLTGSGRPHSAFRAAVLRQWALEGKLPTYEALSGTAGFLGGSMAYLGGSAYLEWLELKAGDDKVLQTLWTRLAGKRDFEPAFKATFGFSPKDGYQRFCAELTHTALELERHAKTEGLREGVVVAQLNGWASDLALSPDGSKLMARVLDPKKPGLYVWDLKAPAKASAKPPKMDPAEPADQAALAPTLPPTQRKGRIHGALPWKPSWTAAETITFHLRLPDGEGVLQPQPRQWILGRGFAAKAAPPESPVPEGGRPSWREVDGIWNLVDAQGRPLTRTLAAAWNPTATPDGHWIYYTQLTASGVQIRKLDATQPPLEPKALPRDSAALIKDQALPKADEPSRLPKPVAVQSHPYRVGDSHDVFSLLGYSDTPSGVSYQLGGGGNDLLNRLSWQVLAGLGNGTGPRGGMLGAAWRGWRWAPSLQVFATLDRPSRQDHLEALGFDRDRRGAEVALERESLGRPWFTLRPLAALERITPAGREGFARSLQGGVASLANRWSLDELGFRGTTTLTGFRGLTGGQTWTLTRLEASAGWLNPWLPITLRVEGGRIGGDPTAWDRFHLGGVTTSLLPASLDGNRVVQAALPAYTATGNRLQRLRGELGLAIFQVYVEHTAVWQDPAPRPIAQRVVGIELDSRSLGVPMDVLRRLTGNLTFTLGLHRPLNGLMQDRTVGTVSMIVRP